jgi:signal transduction histidine kinase
VAQALMNLLDNALKYSPDGTPIEVAAAVVDHEVVVSVKDHGIGIPGEEQRRVFERFHRVGSSLIHDVKGSGLGLSIVEHVMHAHGGRVTLSSALGRGSEFRLHFPLAV